MNNKLLLCVLLLSCATTQAMEDQERSYRKKVIATYLEKCNREDLSKEGLCSSVSGNGVTISAKNQGAATKFTVVVKKLADTSNNPEFGNHSSVADSSYAQLRRDMRDHKHLGSAEKGRIKCTSRYHPYLETDNRSQQARDEECTMHVANNKLYEKNAARHK